LRRLRRIKEEFLARGQSSEVLRDGGMRLQ